jgi:hypothetical protein
MFTADQRATGESNCEVPYKIACSIPMAWYHQKHSQPYDHLPRYARSHDIVSCSCLEGQDHSANGIGIRREAESTGEANEGVEDACWKVVQRTPVSHSLA